MTSTNPLEAALKAARARRGWSAEEVAAAPATPKAEDSDQMITCPRCGEEFEAADYRTDDEAAAATDEQDEDNEGDSDDDSELTEEEREEYAKLSPKERLAKLLVKTARQTRS
jgi:hypothetical protein